MIHPILDKWNGTNGGPGTSNQASGLLQEQVCGSTGRPTKIHGVARQRYNGEGNRCPIATVGQDVNIIQQEGLVIGGSPFETDRGGRSCSDEGNLLLIVWIPRSNGSLIFQQGLIAINHHAVRRWAG